MPDYIADLVVNGKLDAINNDLTFLMGMNLITADQQQKVYDYLTDNGYTSDMQGLQELTDWIRKLWTSYLQYNKLPPRILEQLSEDLPHISSNYIEYIKANAGLINLNDRIIIDIQEFVKFHDHITSYFPNAPFATMLSIVKGQLDNLTRLSINHVIDDLYINAKKLDYEQGISEVIQRKIRSHLNKIRLQLETVRDRVKKYGNDNAFQAFLAGEGISDTVSMIINNL